MLGKEDVKLNETASDKAEALDKVGAFMAACGYVKEGFTHFLKAREEEISTYMINGVALPHGVLSARDSILKNGVVAVQFPDGVDWGDGETVYLAIGLAAIGDDHMTLLSSLAEAIQDEALMDKLRMATDEAEVSQGLSHYSA